MSSHLRFRFENLFYDVTALLNSLKDYPDLKNAQLYSIYSECFNNIINSILYLIKEDLPNGKTNFTNLVSDTNYELEEEKLLYRIPLDKTMYYLDLAMRFRYELVYFGDNISVINATPLKQQKNPKIENYIVIESQFFELLKEKPFLAQIYVVGMLSVLRDINNGFKIKNEKDNVVKRFEAFIALYMIEMHKVGIEIDEENFSKNTVALYRKLSKIKANQYDYPADYDDQKVKKN